MKDSNLSEINSVVQVAHLAFEQLIHLGLKQAFGQVLQANGFTIVIESIRLTDSQLSEKSVRQSFALSLQIEKPRGWMPLKLDMAVLAKVEWLVVDQAGWPCIKLVDFDVSSSQPAKVDILNMNIGLPSAIQRKIFNSISNQKLVVEKRINNLIKAQLQTYLNKTYELQLPENKASIHSLFIQVTRYSWSIKTMQDAIKMCVGLLFYLDIKNKKSKNSKITIEYLEELSEDHHSALQLNIPYTVISDFLVGSQLPLGKYGAVEIVSIKIKPITIDQLFVRLSMKGGLNGSLEFLMNLKFKQEVVVELKDFNMNVNNKLLDFGASLFESPIEKKMQLELNASINQAVKSGMHVLNTYLDKKREFIQFQHGDLSLEQLDVSIDWMANQAQLRIDANIPSNVIVHKIPLVDIT